MKSKVHINACAEKSPVRTRIQGRVGNSRSEASAREAERLVSTGRAIGFMGKATRVVLGNALLMIRLSFYFYNFLKIGV